MLVEERIAHDLFPFVTVTKRGKRVANGASLSRTQSRVLAFILLFELQHSTSMGAAASSLQANGWVEFLCQPKVLTALGVILASTAFVFLGLLRSKRFKGSYAIDVDTGSTKKNEGTLNQAC